MFFLKFLVLLGLSMILSCLLCRAFPVLSHQVFVSGQVGFSWLFFLTLGLLWLGYRFTK